MGGQEEGFDWLIMTPGVGLDDKGDGLGQQYRTVDEVVSTGTDIIIVGRGLFGKGRDPDIEGKRYRDAGWNAYLKNWPIINVKEIFTLLDLYICIINK